MHSTNSYESQQKAHPLYADPYNIATTTLSTYLDSRNTLGYNHQDNPLTSHDGSGEFYGYDRRETPVNSSQYSYGLNCDEPIHYNKREKNFSGHVSKRDPRPFSTLNFISSAETGPQTLGASYSLRPPPPPPATSPFAYYYPHRSQQPEQSTCDVPSVDYIALQFSEHFDQRPPIYNQPHPRYKNVAHHPMYSFRPGQISETTLKGVHATPTPAMQRRQHDMYVSKTFRPHSFNPSSHNIPCPRSYGNVSLVSSCPRGKNYSARHYNVERKMFYCNVCDKDFLTESYYKRHVEQDHYPCSFPGCDYSAPPGVLDVHKLKHINADNTSTTILDDPEEIHRWIEARRERFPRQNQELQKPPKTSGVCAIEKILRQQYQQKRNQGRVLVRDLALLPQLPSLLKRKKTLTIQDNIKKNSTSCALKRRLHPGKEFTFKELKEDFPICEHFLKFKTCKWSPCHFSHNVSAYRRWKIQRNLRGIDISMRPPIIYQLLLPDILECEALVLAALKYIVENNFFLSQENKTSLISPLLSISESHESESSSDSSLEIISDLSCEEYTPR